MSYTDFSRRDLVRLISNEVGWEFVECDCGVIR